MQAAALVMLVASCATVGPPVGPQPAGPESADAPPGVRSPIANIAMRPEDARLPPQASAQRDGSTPVELPPEDGVRVLPIEAPDFWRSVMTPEIAFQYRAINGVSMCTVFVADTLVLHFGEDAFEQVFPNGVQDANATFVAWAENQSLIRLLPEEYSVQDIQRLADQGYLILMAYYFPGIAGHVAFVGHRSLELFTIPPLPGLEGGKGELLDPSWLPVMVQAGTYTGVTSMVYATNNWLRTDNYGQGIVRYYLVKAIG